MQYVLSELTGLSEEEEYELVINRRVLDTLIEYSNPKEEAAN